MKEDLKKDFIWHRAIEIPEQDGEKVRKDCAGAIIHWDEYEQDSEYGWTIVPLVPYSKGGSDCLMSLMPYHVRNAASKGIDFPKYKTVLSSVGMENKENVQYWDFMELL